MGKKKLDYAEAGVDIAAADRTVEKIKKLASATFNESVLSGIGQFGGFYKPNFGTVSNPVLISSADGVGTKLKVAFMTGRHKTVGEDLVNHCINDILVHGARPLFFLDYFATGVLCPEVVADVVEGLSNGCKKAGMALIGGETAEMPDFYAPGEYDLAGFIVGMAEQGKIINGSAIKPGDAVIGLASDGLHTNGYSLARKVVFEIAGLKPEDMIGPVGQTAADTLLTVHRSYLKPVMDALDKFDIKGMAHITGGGLRGNLSRILPDTTQAVIGKDSWLIPPLFSYLQKTGEIDDSDMYRAFNMGIGYVLVVEEHIAGSMVEMLKSSGERPYLIGSITEGSGEVILKD
ncbi:MAG: phosphoribosylformylglycinamidine cyclo-ligase [Candidatus Zixiibacteriota bacterium]|nr:MAG: phosphoribosylformylglycinamidine cyclo-ligase [candidate division Zixibacteria bacterium]